MSLKQRNVFFYYNNSRWKRVNWNAELMALKFFVLEEIFRQNNAKDTKKTAK